MSQLSYVLNQTPETQCLFASSSVGYIPPLHHVFCNSYSPHYKNILNDSMPPHHGGSVRRQLRCQNTDTKMNTCLRHWQKDAQASFSLSFCLILRDRHALTTSSGPFKDMSNKSARLWDAVSHLPLLPNPLSDIRALMKCVNLLFLSFSFFSCLMVTLSQWPRNDWPS